MYQCNEYSLFSTAISIRFSQSDYSAPEEDEQMLVTLQTEGRHATPVTVRVIPVTYDDYLTRGESLPDDFPDVPEFNDKYPNRAKSKQQIGLIHTHI